MCDNGNSWTEAELQAAKKCLRLRKQYDFTEEGELPERVKLKRDLFGYLPNEEAKGVAATGMTVKEKAERERLYEKMDKLRDGEGDDSQDGADA